MLIATKKENINKIIEEALNDNCDIQIINFKDLNIENIRTKLQQIVESFSVECSGHPTMVIFNCLTEEVKSDDTFNLLLDYSNALNIMLVEIV